MMTSRKQAIARRFGGAALGYDAAAVVQRAAASRLAESIAAAGLPHSERGGRPRVLEIGCGTGLLTAMLRRLLPRAEWTVSDLSPEMLRQCRARFRHQPGMRFLAMDAESPALRPGFDLVCGSLALQWLSDRAASLRALSDLLDDGGLLAVSTLCAGSFSGWRAALRAEDAVDAMPEHPPLATLQAEWPAHGAGHWRAETLLERHARGVDFLRSLRAIGADLPRPGASPLDPLALRRVLRRFEAEQGAVADYQIGIGLFRRVSRRGVFVTGTDTGVGKTLVAALLARAWRATYWKPLQTGLRDEPGDTETVRGLAAVATLSPLHELQAPLSPEAAAGCEGVALDLRAARLPDAGAAPLVVEGAGGLMVPIAEGEMMIDLIQRLGLPVVLVARGTLGTINHTLLSLEALRRRGIPVTGVVLNGACTPGSREAIARHGRVRILAELPPLERVDADAVTRLARLMPASPWTMPQDPGTDQPG